jgi:DNA invertase Pin-like site-specific DNA recombinase
MAAISNRFPPVVVEYDCRGTRKQKEFSSSHEAKRFYVAKDRDGKNPTVRKADSTDITRTQPVACYLRVSTVGQNEQGQRREIERWLKGNGIEAESVQWFIDKATGDNIERPGFKRLQAAVFNGGVQAIVVWKLDRISRKLIEGLNVMADWCDRGLRVVSVTQQLDFNGATGKLIASVLFAVAEMEQETRKERQMAGIDAAKERGVYKGRKSGTTKAKPRRAVKLKEKGLSTAEIATALGVSRMTVSRYLKAGS